MDISYKNIRNIAFPVLVSLLVEQLIGITDTAFLGHVGEVELGASAIAGVCYLILFVIGSGFGVGLQVIIARLNGEKNPQQVTSIFSAGFYFLIILATIIIIVSHFFLPSILRYIIKSEDIYSAALSYLNWRVYGLFFAYIVVAFRAYYIGITRTKFLLVSSGVMVVVNIIFNYLLVFGKFGFPVLGIEGAGIGSCIAEFAAALLLLLYYCFTKKSMLFEKITKIQQQWNNLKRILHLSVWTMLQAFLSLASWLAFFIIIEHIGRAELASSNIIRSLSAIPFMLVQAFASTGSSLVSNLMGEGKHHMVLPLCKRVMIVCYCFCIPLLLLIAIFPNLFLVLYTNNDALVQASLPSLYVMLSSYLLMVPAAIFYTAIAGTGNTLMTLKIGISMLIFYVIYLKVLEPFTNSVAVLWTSEYIYALCLFLLSLMYMLRGKWKNKKV